ncbi:TfuA-like protein [Tateyamaria sp. SN3-11]|uniref:TfuA-like protein n=1 Tax=Tateyamaria sp. SN3-11 TaxID=3092147 RepID=UPI0039EA68E8
MQGQPSAWRPSTITSAARRSAPARAGDIYAACRHGATAIGLIDGFFDGVPAVWHKELLWALDQGLPVFGASSMGALRAAELHAFGMIGVGAIFEGFRDGTLEDDDEVALHHGPAELDYIALSEPMVNIRASLDHAVAAGVLDTTTAATLIARAKSMHFPDRTWDRLLTGTGLDDLRAWLRSGAVDQKQRDAIAMLRALQNSPKTLAQTLNFTFQHTVMWEELTQRVPTPVSTTCLILDQLRRDPARYQRLRQRAAKALPSDGAEVPQADLDKATTRFRAQHRLYTGQALADWLADNDLDLPGLHSQLRAELQLCATIAQHLQAFHTAMIDALKADGTHDALLAEAHRMRATFDRAGLPNPSPDDLDIHPRHLLSWYFHEVCGQPVPDDLDAAMQRHDIPDRADFEQMMARAYILWQDQGQHS